MFIERKLIKIDYRLHYYSMLSRFLNYYVHVWTCLWKGWVLADVSWQRTKALMLSGNNEKRWIQHRKIIVTQEFTVYYESAKHLGDVARERILPYFTSFRLFLYRCPPPSLYTVAPVFPISLHTLLCLDSRLVHAKIREIKSLLSRDWLPQIYLVEFQCSFKDSLQLVKSKGHR